MSRRRFDPAATAAAGALALVVWSEGAHPLGHDRVRIWADALVNEWFIWFTVLYVALIGCAGLRTRLPALLGRAGLRGAERRGPATGSASARVT
jgi:hypothetical protein